MLSDKKRKHSSDLLALDSKLPFQKMICRYEQEDNSSRTALRPNDIEHAQCPIRVENTTASDWEHTTSELYPTNGIPRRDKAAQMPPMPSKRLSTTSFLPVQGPASVLKAANQFPSPSTSNGSYNPNLTSVTSQAVFNSPFLNPRFGRTINPKSRQTNTERTKECD